MRKELGLDNKSGYKDSGVGNGKDPGGVMRVALLLVRVAMIQY